MRRISFVREIIIDDLLHVGGSFSFIKVNFWILLLIAELEGFLCPKDSTSETVAIFCVARPKE